MPSPKTPEDLYDAVATLGVRGDTVDAIREWPLDRLLQLVHSVTTNIPSPPEVRASTFNFVASGQLAGLPFPCHGLDCRTGAVDDLSRFAALYADHVVVPPFVPSIQSYMAPMARRRLARPRRGATSKPGKITVSIDGPALERFQRDLADSIAILFALKPLVIARLVSFSDCHHHICPKCINHTIATGNPSAGIKRAITSWDRSTASMIVDVNDELLSLATFTIHRDKRGFFVRIAGGERYYDHERISVRLSEAPPAQIADSLGRSGRQLSKDEVKALEITTSDIQNIVDDLNSQHYYATKERFNYITRRAADAELLQKHSHVNPRISAAAFAALSHPLVYLDGTSVDALLAVRRNDEDAFQGYRDAITKLISTANFTSPAQAREAVDDLVRPEVNKIESTLKRTRRSLVKSFARDLVVAAGAVSIGVFAGIVPETMQAIATATGGVLGAKTIASQALGIFAKPAAVTENQFSFLWQIKRRAKG